MKKTLIILSILLIFLSCSSSQEKQIEWRIDKDLHNKLFDFMPYGVAADISGDSTTDIQFISNANIIEINKKHSRLDTCRSYFYKDTLIIELRSINFSSDKVIVKIKKTEYWAYIVNQKAGISELGKPKSLVFKEGIKNKGQEIFGELIVDFPGPTPNQSYIFYGPFRCIVE